MLETDSGLRETLAIAFHEALSYLEKLDRSPVAATVNLSDLRRRLGKPLARERMAPERIIAELVRDVEGGILGSSGGRFFGWVIGGSLPAALAADWLTSAGIKTPRYTPAGQQQRSLRKLLAPGSRISSGFPRMLVLRW
jgi:hypothetical protein